jgi:hypothetical protein
MPWATPLMRTTSNHSRASTSFAPVDGRAILRLTLNRTAATAGPFGFAVTRRKQRAARPNVNSREIDYLRTHRWLSLQDVVFCHWRMRTSLWLRSILQDNASFAAMCTRSGRDFALIFRIARPRCCFTVISEIPSSRPITLFSSPETTKLITSRSRVLSDS